MYLSDGQIEGILEALREGKPKQQAALENGTSWTQFKSRFKREPKLEALVDEAVSEGRPAFQEMLRSELFHQAFVAKNYRAVRDLAMVHLPEWDVLRTQRFEHTVTGTVALQQAAQEAFAGMSNEEIEARIRFLEEARDQHPVLELPAKSAA